jgi:hypothetical protein
VAGGGGEIWRWSDGNAALMLPADTTLLEIHIGRGRMYRGQSMLRAA